jgi:hypothetical protein
MLSGAMISIGRRWRSEVPRSIHPSDDTVRSHVTGGELL